MVEKRDKHAPIRKIVHPKHLAESSPNPHGESNVIEMPIRTHQRKETKGRNVAQTTSTVKGELNPSVAHDIHTAKAAGGSNQIGSTSPEPDSSKAHRTKGKRH